MSGKASIRRQPTLLLFSVCGLLFGVAAFLAIGDRSGAEMAQGPVANSERPSPHTAVTSAKTGSILLGDSGMAANVSDVRPTETGFVVSGERHIASFDANGMTFRPKTGGPDWRWRLSSVAAGDRQLPGVRHGTVAPISSQTGVVEYPRAAIVERYIAGPNSVEQRFVLPRPLTLDGDDLVVSGSVTTTGNFEPAGAGWLWRTADGVVSLGDVTVIDAAGTRIPADMRVTPKATRIVVDGTGLGEARYPVTIDPEVGTNDFRISQMGPNGALGFAAFHSKAAYNSRTKQSLVVWEGDDEGDLQAEIYGQLVDSRTGAQAGPDDFLVARIGPPDTPGTDATSPTVVYNSVRNEFLVVFVGDELDDPPPPPNLIVDTREIYAQRISAAGIPIGAPLRVSDMGVSDSDDSWDAFEPDVAYNAVNDEYAVVWRGDDNGLGLANNEYEIFVQRLGFSGDTLIEVGDNDARISDAGGSGSSAFQTFTPAITWNSGDNQYLVVWRGDDNVTAEQSDNDFDIFGQRLSADGTQLGTNDFQISLAGVGDSTFETFSPDVTYNPTANQYAVVWEGDNGTGNDFEIVGQLLSTTGGHVGDAVQISLAGDTGDDTLLSQTPAITYNIDNDEYLVVWRGESHEPGFVDDEFEILGRRLQPNLNGVSSSPFRISDMGGDEAGVSDGPDPSPQTPDVVYSDTSINGYLVVWAAANPPFTGEGEGEIWGQLVAPSADLRVTKAVEPDDPAGGDPVTYTITYRNDGPDPAFGVVISDEVPGILQNVQHVTGGPSPTLRPGTELIWDLPRLPAGGEGTITITGTVDPTARQGLLVTNTAQIDTTAITADPDAANNQGNADFVVDNPLSVTVEQAAAQTDPTNSGSILFTAVFSEPVTDFTDADVALSGTAGAAAAVVSGGPTEYTISVSGMTNDGTVQVNLPAGAVVDSAGKPSFASTSTDNTVAYDTTGPTVVIDQAPGQADPTNTVPVVFTVVFSEPVTGFDGGDVTLAGTAAPAIASVSGASSTYTVEVRGMTGDGTVTASIPAGMAMDAAGNAASASTSTDNTVVYDATAPTVTIDQAAAQADPTSATPIQFTVVFSDPVTGFTGNDVTLSGTAGSTAAEVTGSGTTYTVEAAGMTSSGTVIATLGSSAATDAAGNASAASTSTDNTVTFDLATPAPSAPGITTVAPKQGPTSGHTLVTVTGRDLGTRPTVTVNGVRVPTVSVNTVGTRLTFRTPVSEISGPVDVVIGNGSGFNTLTRGFTYVAPQIGAVSPARGSTEGGTLVTISGSGFTGTRVLFDGIEGSGLKVLSTTRIQVRTPAHAAGKVTVVVELAGQDAVKAGAFTYVVPAPGEGLSHTGAMIGGPLLAAVVLLLLGLGLHWGAGWRSVRPRQR